ncbi:SufE family protein [Rhodohalobacter sulfatireducens]|uniref:SufE family protein n=1 Tax=Rhodohalobacter sulfatireducens TaxID=2911366 RepID=A0ABS9K7U9_9BACT|nr:SufE family protein [Rhodohalobacter sulfatireducens]MCG2586930.1 SufE family protein [Rhodohalobacter sulfatireducens]MDR9364443.1 SufE family protein [Balneolaceae bacterium]MDR9409015.1 SufE family protein [Balneolaceae bacterium]
MTIEEKQDRIARQFELLGDWPERYKYIIKLGQKLEPLDEELKVEENLVRGCQSQVWLVTEQDDDKIIFKADSDAAITKGLVAMLVNFYSGENPETILQTDPEFIEEIGMQQHLSPTRSNGLASMVKQMKIYAMAYKSKMGQSVQ